MSEHFPIYEEEATPRTLDELLDEARALEAQFSALHARIKVFESKHAVREELDKELAQLMHKIYIGFAPEKGFLADEQELTGVVQLRGAISEVDEELNQLEGMYEVLREIDTDLYILRGEILEAQIREMSQI